MPAEIFSSNIYSIKKNERVELEVSGDKYALRIIEGTLIVRRFGPDVRDRKIGKLLVADGIVYRPASQSEQKCIIEENQTGLLISDNGTIEQIIGTGGGFEVKIGDMVDGNFGPNKDYDSLAISGVLIRAKGI